MTAADLTPRELDVLQQLLIGRTTREISRNYNVTQQYVSNWVERIKTRIGIRSLFQLGAWAERHGIREAVGG